jgi:hypothetical protein
LLLLEQRVKNVLRLTLSASICVEVWNLVIIGVVFAIFAESLVLVFRRLVCEFKNSSFLHLGVEQLGFVFEKVKDDVFSVAFELIEVVVLLVVCFAIWT